MKIRQRLAFRFTIVSAVIMAAILMLTYMLTRGFVRADFAERLTQQSRLEALHYANPDVMEVLPAGSFQLVNPLVSIYSGEGALLRRTGDYTIPGEWINYVRQKSLFTAERGDYTTVGRKYDINGTSYIVFVSDKDLPGQHELDILLKALSFGFIVSVVLSYLAGLYFSGNALQPVKHVVEEVKQITKDNLGYRLRPVHRNSTNDEIDELIHTFNALLGRIETAFVAQKRFVQNASHELKTPLTAIMAEAELALARERHVDEYKRTLKVVIDETERLVRITQGLLTLARFEEGMHESEVDEVECRSLIDSTVTAFRQRYPDRELELTSRIATSHLRGNFQLLQIALLNILDNAVKYSAATIRMTAGSDKKNVYVTITDTGIGIPEDELSRIRSPLYRASNVSDIPGAGLGLSLVERIVNVHSGELTISSAPGKGTTCVIRLPLAT